MPDSIDRLNTFVEAYNDISRYPTVADVAQALGLSVSRVKSKASEIRAMNRAGTVGVKTIDWRSVNSGATVEIEPDVNAEEDIDQLIERVCVYNEGIALRNDARNVVEVKVNESGWWGVAVPGDPHLNNPGTMLRLAFDQARKVAETPGLYAYGIGDYLDNFIIGKLERARRGDVMSHDQAWRIQERYFEILVNKFLGGVFGNHDRWTQQTGGVHVLKMQLKSLGIGEIFADEEIRIRVITPCGDFIHLIRHGFPGHSKYHPTHGILTWALERWQGEDAFFGGHIHAAGHMTLAHRWQGEKRKIDLVQVPSYKKIDSYKTEKGFRDNDPFQTPILLINSATRETIFVDSFDRGVELLNLLRSGGKPSF